MAAIGNTYTTQGFIPAVDYFNGDGSTVSFTMSRPVASVAQVEAVIENVVQNPGTAYTVSNNTLTFTSAPPSGTGNVYVRYTSPITQLIAPAPGTLGTNGMYEMANTIYNSYTIATGSNAISAGPITINTGVTVTVPTGSTWVIA